VEHLFADIFYRDVLNHQERELVTISILAAMTGTEAQLKTHLGISMNMGLSKAQLEDFVSVLRQEVSADSAERAGEILHVLLGISPAVNQPKSIMITRNDKPKEGSADYFTGHVAISAPHKGATVEWMEPVNDEQYGK
jgi:hypothetical protein